MPQVKNVVINLLIILIGGPLLGAYFAYQTGELTSWDKLPNALQHGGFASFMMAIGWIFLRSPWSGRIMELLQTKTTPDGQVKTTTLKITEPIDTPKDKV